MVIWNNLERIIASKIEVHRKDALYYTFNFVSSFVFAFVFVFVSVYNIFNSSPAIRVDSQ